MTERFDVYQAVTDHIIKAIEAGAGKWEFPWNKVTSGIPFNVVSKKPYRGVNSLLLWITAEEKGYPHHIWGTYKQWQEKGCQVRKGEKSTTIVFWKAFTVQTEKEGEDNDEDTRLVARAYNVFNCAQVDGYEPPALAVKPEFERVQGAEAFFLAVGADIRHGGNRAFYCPSTDHIQLPPFAAFRDAVAYYATLAHETTHWTGDKKRCNREFGKRFGDDAYAAEELVAELGAAYLCADLGLAQEPRPDHAQYIQSWLKVLKADKRAIFTAASKAQQAVDWLHAKAGTAAETHDLEAA